MGHRVRDGARGRSWRGVAGEAAMIKDMSGSASALGAPLTFAPVFKHYLWGGRELERRLGRALPDGVVAESWEISTHPAGVSVVDAGPFAGRTLPGLVAELGTRLTGRRGAAATAVASGGLPLLVKLLDASHALSVQVHPDDAGAATQRTRESGKTEWWYILHAEPGARIVHGLVPGTDRGTLAAAVAAGRIQDHLRRVTVRTGDSILVPAGTVHGILSGIVLVEIQQCSDTTWRLFDWNRSGPDGRSRELHIDRALEVIRFGEQEPVPAMPLPLATGDGWRLYELARCDHFVVERLEMAAGSCLDAHLDGASFEIFGALKGRATVAARAAQTTLDSVRFALLPAAMGDFRVCAATDLVALRTRLPTRE